MEEVLDSTVFFVYFTFLFFFVRGTTLVVPFKMSTVLLKFTHFPLCVTPMKLELYPHLELMMEIADNEVILFFFFSKLWNVYA